MAAVLTKDASYVGTKLDTFLARGMKIWFGTMAFDSLYPTGGEEITLPFTPSHVFIENKSGFVFEYDYTNSKVIAYWADYDLGADGALIDVANTTDLSALTAVRIMAFGI